MYLDFNCIVFVYRFTQSNELYVAMVSEWNASSFLCIINQRLRIIIIALNKSVSFFPLQMR